MERRRIVFERVEEAAADIERLQRDGYEKLGQWSLSQICEHLAIFLNGTRSHIMQQFPENSAIRLISDMQENSICLSRISTNENLQ